MNWLNTIIVSIGTVFSSLFGALHHPVNNTASSTPVQHVIEQTSQVSDRQSIINTVIAMLTAEHNAATFHDAENGITQYATQGVIQQFQTEMSKISTTSITSMQGHILQIGHTYPDPASLQFTVAIDNDMATATTALPDTTTTQPNAPRKFIVSTFQNSITVPLHKEDGQWKVIKIIITSNGIGSMLKNSH